MRIIHFYSENFKRLKVVEFNPDKNVVVIAGKNGQGKSSILDAIWATFKHAASKKKIPEPIRHGEDHAKTVITLDGYTVTRTFKDDKSTLRIETDDGAIVKSPQALLDRIVGDLSFDPLEFANAKDADRREMLRHVFGLDLAEFDANDHQLREDRKDRNRELKMLDGRLRAIKPPTGGEPTSEASVSDLIGQLSTLNLAHGKFQSLRLEEEDINKRIRELEDRREALFRQRSTLADEVGRESDLSTKISALKVEVDNIETRNARAREIAEYMRLRELHDTSKADVERLNGAIELNKIERDEAIEAANIPIAGLSIQEDGIFIGGVPFDQISQAEKIRVSLSIAMSANPELRVIRIVDGSLLDSDNMGLIKQMAEEYDMQVWIEKVDESGQIGIVIEDGEVKVEN